MKNRSLKMDLKSIIANAENIVEVKKGDVSDFSIDIEFSIPNTHSSYIYYENEVNRDEDFVKLNELLKQ
jgi:hypothetical protein